MRFAQILAGLVLGVAVTACAAETGQPEPPTEMGRLAASLKPGEIKELATKGFTRDLLNSWYDWDHDAAGARIYGAQKMFDIMTGNWSNDGKWDPATRQVLYLGIGHYAALKFVTYSADTNEWQLMPVPPWCDPRNPQPNVCGKDGKDGNKSWPRGHMYDRLAISPEHRLFAVNWFGLHLYDIDKKEWLPSVKTASGGKDAYQVMEYFPEMKAFVYECNWGKDLRLWDVEKREERKLGSYPFGIHGVMEYNPVHKVMVFGGGDGGEKGNDSFYLLDKDGKVSKLKPPPVHLRCTEQAKLMCDPVSGEYVVQECLPDRSKSGKVYAFHPLRDEWKEVPGLSFPLGIGFGVSTYGVMMICTNGKVFLYKHKPVWSGDKPETK